MDYVAFGNRVQKYRKKINLTQEKLAEKCGISSSFLGHIERGTRKASLETLISLANMLDVTPDLLLVDSISVRKLEGNIPDGKKAVMREVFKTMLDNLDD